MAPSWLTASMSADIGLIYKLNHIKVPINTYIPPRCKKEKKKTLPTQKIQKLNKKLSLRHIICSVANLHKLIQLIDEYKIDDPDKKKVLQDETESNTKGGGFLIMCLICLQ